jgi:hypothetical protein
VVTRQSDGERRALPDSGAGGLNRPAMQFDELLGNRETEAQSAVAAGK